MNNQENLLIDIKDYKIIREIDKGSYGTVYCIQNVKTNQKFAAKIIKSVDDKNIDREIKIINQLQHPTIIKFQGYSLKDFNDNDRCVIIIEYLSNGDLSNVIEDEMNHKTRDGWDYTQKLINLYGIASGMDYSVSFGITHSDLKPQNVLMTDKLYPKISDFDSARN